MLGLYAFTGWYIGMQNSRIPMLVAITQNVVNIVASLLLVYAAGLKVEGVALGTLIAQWAGFLMAAALWAGCYGRLRRHAVWRGLLARGAMRRFFAVNRDIFLRTLCLVAVTLFFTSAGARQGEVVLAVNALLMQLFTLYSYVMDGFAYAGEALSGRLIGACNRPGLRLAVGRLFAWGGIMAAAFTLAYALGGDAFLSLLTDEPHVVRASHSYVGWALAIPLAGTAAFVWDGVFIGATATRAMLLSMSVAAATFFLVFYLLAPALATTPCGWPSCSTCSCAAWCRRGWHAAWNARRSATSRTATHRAPVSPATARPRRIAAAYFGFPASRHSPSRPRRCVSTRTNPASDRSRPNSASPYTLMPSMRLVHRVSDGSLASLQTRNNPPGRNTPLHLGKRLWQVRQK